MASPTIEQLAAEIEKLKSQPDRIVVIPRERTVSKFSGSGVNQFVEEIRSLWDNRTSSSTKDKLESIFSNIDSEVRSEIRCHPKSVQDDPEKLLTVLLDIYGERRGVSELIGVFYQVHQQNGEAVRSFSHRLKRAFDQLQVRQRQMESRPLEESVLRDQFVSQLRSSLHRRQLKEIVFEKKDVSFFDVRDVAIRWSEEEAEAGSRQSGGAPASSG